MMTIGGMLGNLCVFSALFRMSHAEMMSMTGTRPVVTENVIESTKENSGNEQKTGNDNFKSNRRLSVYQNARRHLTAFVKSYTNLLTFRFVMICLVSAFLTGFGHFAFVIYFVSNAIDVGIQKTDAAFLLSIFGICGTIGRLGCGPIIDRKFLSSFDLGGVILFIGGSVCILGSLAKSYITLAILAIILGLTSGSYIVFYTLIFREVVGVKNIKMTWGIGGLLWEGSALVALPLIGKLVNNLITPHS